MSKGSQFSIHCQNCSFSHLCLPVALNKTEIESLDDIIERKKPLHKGDTLIQTGDKFRSLFAVRTGSFKSFVTNTEGEEQITGFHSALETAMVCELPYETLDEMSVQFPKLRHQIMSFMSAEIKQDHDMIMLLNKRTAEERLLYFISHLSQRFEERGFSHREFHLTMTRNEIGNYLGLTKRLVVC